MLPTLLNAKLKFRASTTAKSNRPVAEFMDHFNNVKQCSTEQYLNNCKVLRLFSSCRVACNASTRNDDEFTPVPQCIHSFIRVHSSRPYRNMRKGVGSCISRGFIASKPTSRA